MFKKFINKIVDWNFDSTKKRIFHEYKKKKSLLNKKLLNWINEIKIWKFHVRFAKSHIYNKMSEISAKLIKNIENSKKIWKTLKIQFFDIDFTIRHITYQKFVNCSLKFCDWNLNKFIVIFLFFQRKFKKKLFDKKINNVFEFFVIFQ